jgi:hypothetical protein
MPNPFTLVMEFPCLADGVGLEQELGLPVPNGYTPWRLIEQFRIALCFVTGEMIPALYLI